MEKPNTNLPKEVIKDIAKSKDTKPINPQHHSGKGTRARLNTAADKMFFNSKYST